VENINIIEKMIFLLSTNGAESTVINGGSSGSVVYIRDINSDSLVVEGFTVTNGFENHGGGILIYNSTIELKHMIVKNNIATEQGGGIYIMQSSNVIINNSEFIENSSGGGGGAIHYHQSSNGKIINSIIENNICGYEGIIYLSGSSEVDLENCLVVNNTANDHGIFFSYGGKSRISNSTFYNNSINNTGGAIGLGQSDTVFVINSIVYNNNPASFFMYPNEQWEPIVIDYTDAEGGESAVINGNISEVIWGDGNIDTNPLFCNPDSGDYTLAENSPCIDAGDPSSPFDSDGTIADMGAFGVGCSAILAIEEEFIPMEFALHQNYPNPFNPVTTLRYDLPEDALVNITIYDIMGRSIRSLVNSRQTAGYRSIQWNATNNLGEPVSAGIYIYMIQAGEFRQTKKMVLLK